MAKARGMDPTADLLSVKSLPPFAALRAFEAVGRVGGIRKAAGLLCVDHTVVGRHIRSLEQWLGTPLFQRSGGGLSLNETGEMYHQRIASAMVEIAVATAQVRRDGNVENLRLWCVPGFATQWLSEQLAEFERLQPESAIEMRPTDEAADLIMHEADIDVRFYGDAWLPVPGGKGLRCIEIARPPIMAVANPEVAQRLSALEHVSLLAEGPLLHEEHCEQWRAWFALNGVQTADRLPGPLLWHAHLAIAAARQGRGVALASHYLVGNDLANGSLVEVTPPGSRPVVVGGYSFVTREDRWNAPPIVKLRRFLQSKAI